MFDVDKVRQGFPALIKPNPAIYFDGPGGTQVSFAVMRAMTEFMADGVANLGGFYQSSISAQQQMDRTRGAMAALINAKDSKEISFGQNMTTITWALSHAIANTWSPKDNIVISELDHEANISPWLIKAREKGINVEILSFDQDSYTLDLDRLEAILKNGRTKLIAITLASNICGSITDITRVCALAKQYQVKLFVDAVHFIAHQKVDVQVIDCDWLVCSGYKFSAPHIGVLYSKSQTMASIKPYKIAPAPDTLPYALETGTQNFEALTGLEAAIYHKAALVNEQMAKTDLKAALKLSMSAIETHELMLKSYFLKKLEACPHITVHGIASQDKLSKRTPTFAITIAGVSNRELAQALARHNICVGFGHFYVPRFIEKLGLDPNDGVLRIGFAYYNTLAEIDYLFDVLAEVTQFKSNDAVALR
ncbi:MULTISPECIES: cysteine desulfurase-like protein [Cysteiniphilum]|uniref:Cysteine desulfurase-like protein n=1 Tax=Cysteiniphilum litorale TaxID=2056700 RepID=A0A8J2Z527_9GAMM|nr:MULTISPECIES: cysteine desulfurase-like protein [Cysteiniphilum]GGG00286.1 cysteine desulfurase-like protein [Cysteiniphilum litorale]